MHRLMLIAAIGTLAIGCKKNKKTDEGADKGMATAALVAEAAPADLTASDKPPFEAVKLVMNGKRHTNGWPKYDLYNLGNKPVTFVAIYGYAYDKDGKQVARTSVPLSWNGETAPGTKDSFDLMIGGNDKVPASAVSYAVCYDAIKFKGDTDMTTQDGRCPEQMAKGAGTAPAPAPAPAPAIKGELTSATWKDGGKLAAPLAFDRQLWSDDGNGNLQMFLIGNCAKGPDECALLKYNNLQHEELDKVCPGWSMIHIVFNPAKDQKAGMGPLALKPGKYGGKSEPVELGMIEYTDKNDGTPGTVGGQIYQDEPNVELTQVSDALAAGTFDSKSGDYAYKGAFSAKKCTCNENDGMCK